MLFLSPSSFPQLLLLLDFFDDDLDSVTTKTTQRYAEKIQHRCAALQEFQMTPWENYSDLTTCCSPMK